MLIHVNCDPQLLLISGPQFPLLSRSPGAKESNQSVTVSGNCMLQECSVLLTDIKLDKSVNLMNKPLTSNTDLRKKHTCYVCLKKFCTSVELCRRRAQCRNGTNSPVLHNSTDFSYSTQSVEEITKLKNNPFRCDTCKCKLKTFPDLRRHTSKRTGNCIFFCALCFIHLSNANLFLCHVMAHKINSDVIKFFKCKGCSTCFGNYFNFRKHENVCHMLKSNTYSSKAAAVTEDREILNISCEVCYDVCNAEEELMSHMKFHMELEVNVPDLEAQDVKIVECKVRNRSDIGTLDLPIGDTEEKMRSNLPILIEKSSRKVLLSNSSSSITPNNHKISPDSMVTYKDSDDIQRPTNSKLYNDITANGAKTINDSTLSPIGEYTNDSHPVSSGPNMTVGNVIYAQNKMASSSSMFTQKTSTNSINDITINIDLTIEDNALSPISQNTKNCYPSSSSPNMTVGNVICRQNEMATSNSIFTEKTSTNPSINDVITNVDQTIKDNALSTITQNTNNSHPAPSSPNMTIGYVIYAENKMTKSSSIFTQKPSTNPSINDITTNVAPTITDSSTIGYVIYAQNKMATPNSIFTQKPSTNPSVHDITTNVAPTITDSTLLTINKNTYNSQPSASSSPNMTIGNIIYSQNKIASSSSIFTQNTSTKPSINYKTSQKVSMVNKDPNSISQRSLIPNAKRRFVAIRKKPESKLKEEAATNTLLSYVKKRTLLPIPNKKSNNTKLQLPNAQHILPKIDKQQQNINNNTSIVLQTVQDGRHNSRSTPIPNKKSNNTKLQTPNTQNILPKIAKQQQNINSNTGSILQTVQDGRQYSSPNTIPNKKSNDIKLKRCNTQNTLPKKIAKQSNQQKINNNTGIILQTAQDSSPLATGMSDVANSWTNSSTAANPNLFYIMNPGSSPLLNVAPPEVPPIMADNANFSYFLVSPNTNEGATNMNFTSNCFTQMPKLGNTLAEETQMLGQVNQNSFAVSDQNNMLYTFTPSLSMNASQNNSQFSSNIPMQLMPNSSDNNVYYITSQPNEGYDAFTRNAAMSITTNPACDSVLNQNVSVPSGSNPLQFILPNLNP